MQDNGVLPNEPVLSLIDLEKRYAPRRGYSVEAFDDEEDEGEAVETAPRTQGGWTLSPITASFFPGERVALIGGHDAGKTTLLRLIAGTLLANAGSVRAERTCLLNDYLAPFNADASLRDNLALIARLQGVAPEALLGRMGEIEQVAGVTIRLQAPARAIAKAEYGKIATAAALLTEPAVILADNSLGSGDADFRDRLKDRVLSMTDAGAVLLFAPRKTKGVHPLCRRGLWLDDGRVIVDGPAADAINSYLESDEDEEIEDNAEEEEIAAPRRRRAGSEAAVEAPYAGPALASSESTRFGDLTRFEVVDESSVPRQQFTMPEIAFRLDLEVWIANQLVDIMIEVIHSNIAIAMLQPPEAYRFDQPGKLSLLVHAPRELMTNRAYTARAKVTFLDADLVPTEMVVHLARFEVESGVLDERLRRFHRQWPPKRLPLTTDKGVWEIATSDRRGPSA